MTNNTMKTHNKELRKLAEKYFFEQAQLEEHELLMLKNSKFSNVLRHTEGSVFVKLAENALKELEISNDNVSSNDRKKFFAEKQHHHASPGDLEALTDSIKDEFDITVPPDYSHISVDVLKEYIKKYADQYIDNADTRFEIQNALKHNDARAIMGSLYTHLAM